MKYKLIALDMDGTLYLDGDLFPCTLPILEKIKEIGGQYLFLTNNSSKSAYSYVEKLNKMGIEATIDQLVSSVQATAKYLLEHHKEELIYVAGTESLKKELREAGLRITDTLEGGNFEAITCLLQGFEIQCLLQFHSNTFVLFFHIQVNVIYFSVTDITKLLKVGFDW